MNELLDQEVYALPQHQKMQLLGPALHQLDQHHLAQCPAFARVRHVLGATPGEGVAALAPLHVNLFKQHKLLSIAEQDIFKTLYSSGTSGQPSTIYLDSHTAALQSKVLVKVMQAWLGKARLPMLIIDCPATTAPRAAFSARAAGIKGLAFLGRNHCYALNDDLSPNWPAIEAFVAQFGEGPVLIFGFTFLVWQHFLEALAQADKKLALPQAILLHSGGWKKLEAIRVDNASFKARCLAHLGTRRVHNFYGLVEQVGAIFVECEAGHLHAPVYADVLVRDPLTLAPLAAGQEGVLQLCSAVPQSYPGHLLLTEDRARLLGEDDCNCGRKGRYFEVLGRLAKAQLRGCSDTLESTP